MSTLETILHFVQETFTDNHVLMRSVLSRWEDYKSGFAENDLIDDKKYRAFAAEKFPRYRMFIISTIRQYEAHLAEQKVKRIAVLN